MKETVIACHCKSRWSRSNNLFNLEVFKGTGRIFTRQRLWFKSALSVVLCVSSSCTLVVHIIFSALLLPIIKLSVPDLCRMWILLILQTSTIVGMVSTLLIEQPGVRILVCAPSNAALDEVAVRLTHCMVDKFGNTYSPMDGTVVRFGSKKVMHSLAQVISLDNLALRLSSSSRCSRSWVDILDGASVVCATLSGCGNCTFDELEKMFDIVIIDEAAQAVEAEVLIALKRVRGRCVLVGDPKQLPATVFQRPSTAYGRSLFERFQGAGVPVHMLTTQYRMHPSICCYPSQQFYGGALRDSTRTSSMQSIFRQEVCREGINIRGCKFRLGHYYFMDVGWGIEREEIVGHSRANFEEALVVCNVVEGVVKGLLSGLKPNLGVITPYIAQRSEIEGQLERRGIDGTACEVNTVDGFQGREKDVIVLSCVRAMADRGLGFVSDERRMNVALTRAKFSLIIVGHAETLQKWSATWGLLIDDARKRGCYQVLSNCSIQAKSARSWKQRPHPGTDVHGMVEEDTQKPSSSSRNSKREVENNAGAKPSGGDLEATNKTVEKSFTVKREVNLTEDNPGVAVHSKKKSKKRNVNESSSILKKQKVVSDVAEPSVMKRPHKLEELEQESPAIQKKKKTKPVVFCLPSLYSVSQSDLTPSARSLEVPIRKIKEEIIDSLPKFSSERKVGAVSASEVPGLISVKKEEEVENEAIFSAPNAFECRNPLMCDETPANPIPRGIGNRSDNGTQRRTSGCLPSLSEQHLPHSRQPSSRSVCSSYPASSTQGFATFDEYDMAGRKPHWGNSYEETQSPCKRFRAHELNMGTHDSTSVLTRANNSLGVQCSNRDTFQLESRILSQHPNSAHTPLHGNQPLDHLHNQPLWTPRQMLPTPPRNKRRGKSSQSAANASRRSSHKGHRKFNGRRSHPDR